MSRRAVDRFKEAILEVLHVPFLPFVVQWWIVDEWEFYSAHTTYLEAHAAADMLAKDTEFVRVVSEE